MILSHRVLSPYYMPDQVGSSHKLSILNLTTPHDKGILRSLLLQMSKLISVGLSDLLNIPQLVQDRTAFEFRLWRSLEPRS